MKFKDYEIRPALDMEGNETKGRYELVKWQRYDGNKQNCFVIAWLEWDAHEPCWSIRSVGMRLIEFWSSGLNEFVQKWAELADVCMRLEDEV